VVVVQVVELEVQEDYQQIVPQEVKVLHLMVDQEQRE
jgi:hypothetical protein